MENLNMINDFFELICLLVFYVGFISIGLFFVSAIILKFIDKLFFGNIKLDNLVLCYLMSKILNYSFHISVSCNLYTTYSFNYKRPFPDKENPIKYIDTKYFQDSFGKATLESEVKSNKDTTLRTFINTIRKLKKETLEIALNNAKKKFYIDNSVKKYIHDTNIYINNDISDIKYKFNFLKFKNFNVNKDIGFYYNIEKENK